MAFRLKSDSTEPGIPSQTVIVPAFNESFRIAQSLRDIIAYLKQQVYESELLLIDDGSYDDTLAIAREIARDEQMLTVHTFPHAGKATAVIAGLERATGDLILFTDADLATPIEYLGLFRKASFGGFDIVIGSREGQEAVRIGEPAFRHVMGRGFNAVVRLLLLPGIHDTQCGFKLFTRDATQNLLDRLRLYRHANGESANAKVTAFDVELLVAARRLGYQIKIIPVSWTFGEGSKVHPASDTFTNLEDVLRVKWNDLRGRYD